MLLKARQEELIHDSITLHNHKLMYWTVKAACLFLLSVFKWIRWTLLTSNTWCSYQIKGNLTDSVWNTGEAGDMNSKVNSNHEITTRKL